MKKIVYILATNHIAGTEIHVINLIKEIKSKYEITVISSGGEFAKEINKLGVNSEIIDMMSGYSLKSIVKIYKKIKKEKYDIIHLHLPKSFLLGTIAGKMYGKSKIIVTEHLWSSYNSNYSKIRNKIHLFIYRILTCFVDDIIVVSKAVENFLEKKIKVKKEKLNLIYNGSHVNKNLLFKTIENKEKIIFGIVGRLSKEKSHYKLIQVFKELNAKDIKLRIIGKGELEEQIKNKIKKEKLENMVELVGFLNNRDTIYKNIDVLVLSSERECFPMVIIEAMSYGVPVIATDVGGVSEAVQNYKTGRVIKYFDEKEYKEAILEMCIHQNFKKYSINSLKRFKNLFNMENMITQTIEIYEKNNKNL